MAFDLPPEMERHTEPAASAIVLAAVAISLLAHLGVLLVWLDGRGQAQHAAPSPTPLQIQLATRNPPPALPAPPADPAKPLVDPAEPLRDDQKPVIGNEKPLAEDKEPSVDGKEPLADGQEPSAEEKEPSAEEKEPSADGKEPSADSQVHTPPLAAGEPPSREDALPAPGRTSILQRVDDYVANLPLSPEFLPGDASAEPGNIFHPALRRALRAPERGASGDARLRMLNNSSVTDADERVGLDGKCFRLDDLGGGGDRRAWYPVKCRGNESTSDAMARGLEEALERR